MRPKLKNCPCCGNPAIFRQGDGENLGGEFIECSNEACGLTSRLMFPDKTDVKPLLAETWNTRTITCRQRIIAK